MMEIDVIYLNALIQDCQDPISVLRTSKLPGEAHSVQHARNALISNFAQPMQYTHNGHAAHIAAMRLLGVDVPHGEAISVIARKRVEA